MRVLAPLMSESGAGSALRGPAAFLNGMLGVFLVAFYSNFAFKLGNYQTFFYLTFLCFLLTLTQALLSSKASRQFGRSLAARWWPGLVALAVVLVPSVLPIEAISARKQSLQHLIYSGLTVLMMYWFLCRCTSRQLQALSWAVPALLGLAVLLNAYHVLFNNRIAGIYHNYHYLALLCLFAVPVFARMLLQPRLWGVRVSCLGLLLVSLYLLLSTGSRPAWLALLGGYLAASAALLKGRVRLYALLGGIVVPAMLLIVLPERFARRLQELIVTLKEEERVTLWVDSWQMLADSQWFHWLLGHGVGSFRSHFMEYSTFQVLFTFPHNFVLELLFDNGLVGLAAVGFLLYKLLRLVQSLRRTACDQASRGALYLLVTLLAVHGVFCFFTVSLYSFYFLLMLAPLVAALMHLQHRGVTDAAS